jgi:hypothetical protein
MLDLVRPILGLGLFLLLNILTRSSPVRSRKKVINFSSTPKNQVNKYPC